MDAGDYFAATCMVENQNHKKDLGQEGRLSLNIETTKNQHISRATQSQAVTSICSKHARTKLC